MFAELQLLLSDQHTIEVFRLVAVAHTLLPKMKQNDYDAAFKLYMFVAYKPVGLICEESGDLRRKLMVVAYIQVPSN